jgi:hypothetical protein
VTSVSHFRGRLFADLAADPTDRIPLAAVDVGGSAVSIVTITPVASSYG